MNDHYKRRRLCRGWLNILLINSEDPDVSGDRFDDTYYTWGFRIYRTSYGASSEQQWQDLIEKIQSEAKEETAIVTGSDENDPTFQKVWQLFRLDVHSDAATLDGLDLDQLREVHNNNNPPIEGEYMWRRQGVFLVADSEVFGDDGSWIKCVQADYVAADHVSRNKRYGPQRYFGWMKMTTQSVADLWEQMGMSVDFETIAPPTIGGMHLVIWDGD
jgi:hypothetical protein